MTSHRGKSAETGHLPDPSSINRIAGGIHSLERLYEEAVQAKIMMDVLVRPSGMTGSVHFGDDDPVYAASINKLLIAGAALDTADHVLIADSDLSELMSAMLRESDEDAASKLASLLNGPDAVNEYAHRAGYEVSRLGEGADGKWHLGTTNASEAMRQLDALITVSKDDSPRARYLRRTCVTALTDNSTRYGVRSRYWSGVSATLVNKTGDYYGENDQDVGYAVHHDVGVLVDADGKTTPYALMSRSKNKKQAKQANGFIARMGDELLAMAGVRTAPAMAGFRIGIKTIELRPNYVYNSL